jgi:hypothetical protein
MSGRLLSRPKKEKDKTSKERKGRPIHERKRAGLFEREHARVCACVCVCARVRRGGGVTDIASPWVADCPIDAFAAFGKPGAADEGAPPPEVCEHKMRTIEEANVSSKPNAFVYSS